MLRRWLTGFAILWVLWLNYVATAFFSNPPANEILVGLMFGALGGWQSEAVLLGVWTACGSGPARRRAYGSAIVLYAAWLSWVVAIPFPPVELIIFTAAILFLVFAISAVSCWLSRVMRPQWHGRARSGAEGQFSLSELMGWLVVVSLVCGVSRLVLPLVVAGTQAPGPGVPWFVIPIAGLVSIYAACVGLASFVLGAAVAGPEAKLVAGQREVAASMIFIVAAPLFLPLALATVAPAPVYDWRLWGSVFCYTAGIGLPSAVAGAAARIAGFPRAEDPGMASDAMADLRAIALAGERRVEVSRLDLCD